MVATGDMLRTAIRDAAPLGVRAGKHVKEGTLVPDGLMIDLVGERIARPDCARGFMLDGFPRTIAQAKALAGRVAVDVVVELFCDSEKIVARMAGRRVHPGSGRVYHLQNSPPQRPGVDDVTGEALVQRHDDEPATVRKRLRVYFAHTAPLSDYYAAGGENFPRHLRIDSDRPIAEVAAEIARSLL